MSKSLIRNTGIYITINFLSQGSMFFLWIILSRMLVPAEIGVYALVFFVVEFFSALGIFGTDAAVTRFYYTKDSIVRVLANALVVMGCSLAVSITILALSARALSLILPGISGIIESNIPLFAVIIAVNTLSNFALVHYTALKKARVYATLNLVKIVLFCASSLLLVRQGFGIFGLFYALLVSSASIVGIFLVRERATYTHTSVTRHEAGEISSYALPLMLYSIFGITIVYFSRILLDRYTDLSTLGIYSFFIALVSPISGLWNSFNRAWTPEVFSNLSEDLDGTLRRIKSVTFSLSFLYLTVLAAFIIIGEAFLFNMLFEEAYLPHLYLFYILLIGPLFAGIYTISYPLYFYKHRTKKVLGISVVINCLNIAVTFSLVRLFAQAGAAISFFVMAYIGAFFYLRGFQKEMSIPGEIVDWTILLFIMMALAVAALLYTSSSGVFLFFVLGTAMIAYRMGDLSRSVFFTFLIRVKESFVSA